MASPAHRPLRGLFGAIFLAGFNDNVLRVVVIFLLLDRAGDRETAQQEATTSAFLAFCLPYILLSVPAGWISDSLSKRTVIVGAKVLEVGVMGLCAWALVESEWWALLGIVALLGTLGALLSPPKYAILPEVLPPHRLSHGNGQLYLWTFLAIILGSATGGLLLDTLRERRWILGAFLGVLALWGVFLAWSIPRVPAQGLRRGPLASLRAAWSDLRTDRSLQTGLAGSFWFWSLAALVQQDVVVYAQSALELRDTDKSFLLAALFVGVGVGSAAAGMAARGHLGLRLVPLGAAGAAGAACAFGWLAPTAVGAAGLLFLLGFASGFFVVPINALIQQRSPAGDRGAVIAIVNVVVFAGILGGSGLASGLAYVGLHASEIMFAVGVVAALGGLWFAVRGVRAARPT